MRAIWATKRDFVKGSSRHGCRLSRLFDSCRLALGDISPNRTGTGLIGNQRLRPAQSAACPVAVRA